MKDHEKYVSKLAVEYLDSHPNLSLEDTIGLLNWVLNDKNVVRSPQTMPEVKWPEAIKHIDYYQQWCIRKTFNPKKLDGCSCGAHLANKMLEACRKAVNEAQLSGLDK